MKTLSIIGVTLIIGGLILAAYGYSLYANVKCLCPQQVAGKPVYCNCGEEKENIGHFTIYVGISMMAGGVGFLVYSWRKSTPSGKNIANK